MAAETGHGSHMSVADMQEHLKTWKGFLTLVKWVLIGAFVVMSLLAIFRTHN